MDGSLLSCPQLTLDVRMGCTVCNCKACVSGLCQESGEIGYIFMCGICYYFVQNALYALDPHDMYDAAAWCYDVSCMMYRVINRHNRRGDMYALCRAIALRTRTFRCSSVLTEAHASTVTCAYQLFPAMNDNTLASLSPLLHLLSLCLLSARTTWRYSNFCVLTVL